MAKIVLVQNKREDAYVERWVKNAAETCFGKTGDVGWQFLIPTNLRRRWGTLLVEARMIMTGWEDWETFSQHYLGA